MKTSCLKFLILLTGIAIFTVAAAHQVAAADKHPFNIDDYSAIRSARAVAISPDGKTILYRVSFVGTTGPADKHEWHAMNYSGENARKLELPEKFEAFGFTKDGTALYGVLPVGNSGQLAIVPLGEGRPTQIIALPSGIHGAIISPDGTRFAVLADPRKADPLSGVHTVVENDETSVYVVGANGAEGAWWCPALTDVLEIAWSADSSQLAVVTQLPKMGHHELRSSINVCSASSARRVTEIPNGTSGIAWSQNGQELIFASTNTPTITPEHVWTAPVAGGQPSDRTPNLAGTAMTLTSDPHGNIWIEMHKGVVTEVDAFRDGKLETAYRWPAGIVLGLPVFSPFASASGAMAFNVEDPSHATNIAVVRGSELQKITHEGDDILANINLGDVKAVHWTAKDGTKLEGIATFPADYVAGKKCPFLVF